MLILSKMKTQFLYKNFVLKFSTKIFLLTPYTKTGKQNIFSYKEMPGVLY